MYVRSKYIPLFLVAGILFGIKTYLIYRFYFHVEIENAMQEFILFLNPLVTSVVFFAIAVWFNNHKKRRIFIRYSTLIGTIILYFNLLFYRSFTDFLTIPQITQMNNMADLSSSIISLIKIYDLLLIVDVIAIWMLSKKSHMAPLMSFSKRNKVFTLVCSLILLCSNFLLAEMERPQLLSRAFDREYLVKNIGVFYYHMYDIALQSKMRTEKVLANDHDLKKIKSYVNEEIRSDQQSDYFGKAKNRNIIFISAESIQSFVIDNTLNGQEITPFLNELRTDSDTFYFENFYHQTAQGKTSDSEFITENSLYPLSGGAVFFTHAENEYHSMSEILNNHGYESYVFHANQDTFWNRNQMYESLDVTDYFDKSYFDVEEDNEIGWGLKDKSFFKQAIPYMEELQQPFYAKMITITNHFPFELNEEDRSIEPYDSNSNTLNNYFPTVRYTDEAIEGFFQSLKAANLYDNSIIVIMGDHDGISANHNKAMAEFLEKDSIDAYDYQQLQRVPFFVHIPGSGDGEIKESIAGQVDIKPTLLHLAGIDTNHDIYFGNDLFHDDRKGFITQRNGNFISDDYIYANEVCYDRETGEIIDEKTTETNDDKQSACADIEEKVETELIYSDNIIYGDLFRFLDFEAK